MLNSQTMFPLRGRVALVIPEPEKRYFKGLNVITVGDQLYLCARPASWPTTAQFHVRLENIVGDQLYLCARPASWPTTAQFHVRLENNINF